MSKVNVTESQVTILIEVDGRICLMEMGKNEYKTVSMLAKRAVTRLYKTNVTQNELNKFLMPSWFEK